MVISKAKNTGWRQKYIAQPAQPGGSAWLGEEIMMKY